MISHFILYRVWFYHKDAHTCCGLLGSKTVYSGSNTYFVLGQLRSLLPSHFSIECELVLSFQVPVPSLIVKVNEQLLTSPSSSLCLFYLSFLYIRYVSTPINLLYLGCFFPPRLDVIFFVVLQPKLGPSPIIVEISRSYKIRHTHTHTPSRTCLNLCLARLRGRYLHNTRKRGIYMPSADFEPAIPAI